MILGDIGQQQDDTQSLEHVGSYLRDAAYHVPLLILAPQYLKRPQRFEHISSHTDIQPTLLDLLQWSGPHHSMGQSLVRQPQRRSAYSTPPFAPGYQALRTETWRFNVRTDGSQASLFDLVQDPHQRHNLVAEQAARVAAYRQEVLKIQDIAARLHQQNIFCSANKTVFGKR